MPHPVPDVQAVVIATRISLGAPDDATFKMVPRPNLRAAIYYDTNIQPYIEVWQGPRVLGRRIMKALRDRFA